MTLAGTRLEDALHRCITLASPYGSIWLLKPVETGVREFVLDLGENSSDRLRWTLRSTPSGTELSIVRQFSVSWLTTLGQRDSSAGPDLARTLDLIPKVLNLKIVVVGGGTGLYTTLLGLRERSLNLTAVISGRPPKAGRDPKDELGPLPSDNASLCLVALAAASDETLTLRNLLEHRMSEGRWRGAHFGSVLLEALTEIHGSTQAGLDAGTKLLGAHGRIVVADDPADALDRTAAVDAIMEADMLVVAPGNIEPDALSVLARPRIAEAVEATRGIRVIITKIMTAEGDPFDEPTTSYQLKTIKSIVPMSCDVVVANSASFTRQQLEAYAAVGARPVLPDLDMTSAYATSVVTEELVAPGHLARHDAKRLAEVLVDIGTQAVISPRDRPAVPVAALAVSTS
jgi:2-phospho-L-lactate transferase/gluconeogenesis factor (CofD/UPF0052 family)